MGRQSLFVNPGIYENWPIREDTFVALFFSSVNPTPACTYSLHNKYCKYYNYKYWNVYLYFKWIDWYIFLANFRPSRRCRLSLGGLLRQSSACKKRRFLLLQFRDVDPAFLDLLGQYPARFLRIRTLEAACNFLCKFR